MTGVPMTGVPMTEVPVTEPIVIANEFAEVLVEKVETRNGTRLRIRAPRADREILLCPLELEALTHQDHDLFSRLLAG